MTNTCSVHAEWTAPRAGKDLYLALRDRPVRTMYTPEFRFLGRDKGFAVTPAMV